MKLKRKISEQLMDVSKERELDDKLWQRITPRHSYIDGIPSTAIWTTESPQD